MKFKTLTIKEAVYKDLLKTKGEKESFSDLFGRLIKETRSKPNLMKFAGAWANLSEKEFEKIKKAIKELRESADKNFEERMKRLYG